MTGTLIPGAPAAAPLLLDSLMPGPDAAATVTVVVAAAPATTYAAVLETDFAEMPAHDPLLRWAIAARGLPDRIARALRDGTAGPPIAETGGRLGAMREGPDAWIRLGEAPGAEFAFGAIGRFLGAEVTWRPTRAAEFAAFGEPGFVRIAAALSVRPYGERRTLLTYDCRARAMDDRTRKAFRRYWTVLSPGIRLVLWRAAAAIAREAEAGAG
jgi:hypothetical protein